jgi:hypothetical protein
MIFRAIVIAVLFLPTSVFSATVEDLKDFCQGRIQVNASAFDGSVSYEDGEVRADGSSITVFRRGATIDQLDFGQVGYLGCVERLGKAFGLIDLAVDELQVICDPGQVSVNYVEFFLDGVSVDPSQIDIDNFVGSLEQTNRTFYLDRLGYAYVRNVEGNYRRHESEAKFEADMRLLRETGFNDFVGIVVDYEEESLSNTPFFIPGVRDGFLQSLVFVDDQLSTNFRLSMDFVSNDGQEAYGWVEGYAGFCYVP